MNVLHLNQSTPKLDMAYIKEMQPDYIVSYGYRYWITEPMITAFRGKMINLHISLLPWNRGADPNFWSLYDDTPKGITIHYIDIGHDTGDILMQREICFDDDMTLKSSYGFLRYEMDKMMDDFWPDFIDGRIKGTKQPPGGSYNKKFAIDKHRKLLLARGWDTPILQIVNAGKEAREKGPQSIDQSP